MDIILFFVLAIAMIFISIKLSYYADVLDNNTNLGGLIIGGILLAGSTSLPELITSISSVLLKNPSLALGDILGSNIFNIFVISLFDIMYLKYKFMERLTYKYISTHLIMIGIYIILISYFRGNFVSGIINIGIPSVAIIIGYFIYLIIISKAHITDKKPGFNENETKAGLKFVITVIILIIVSILLTYQVNSISINYPTFTSSIYGAFLLGVTTSIPEIVSMITLFKIGSYNLAFSNMIGSNIISLLFLALIDSFLLKKCIYDFYDKDTIYLCYIGLGFTIILLYSALRKSYKPLLLYIMPSILIFIVYVWFSLFYLFS
ncbi:MAG: hypothetical protein PHS45_01820 [Bacilli bacterium]|nr:hypothetical protein [Bacilli bacterium]